MHARVHEWEVVVYHVKSQTKRSFFAVQILGSDRLDNCEQWGKMMSFCQPLARLMFGCRKLWTLLRHSAATSCILYIKLTSSVISTQLLDRPDLHH